MELFCSPFASALFVLDIPGGKNLLIFRPVGQTTGENRNQVFVTISLAFSLYCVGVSPQ